MAINFYSEKKIMEIMVRKFLGVSTLAFIFSSAVEAASFDCAKAATQIEKLICGDSVLSTKDEQLASKYKDALNKAAVPDQLKQQQVTWLKTVRNKCDSVTCLSSVYDLQIEILAAIGASRSESVPRSNFKIVEGDYNPICQEYLKVINRSKWDDLKACSIPSLQGSPIKEIQFQVPALNDIRAIDKIVYEQGYRKTEFDNEWPSRSDEIAKGARLIDVAYLDLDGDGQKDQIVREMMPSRYCEPLSKGNIEEEDGLAVDRWNKFDDGEKIISAKKNGYRQILYLIKNEKLYYVRGENFVSFDNREYVILTDGLRFKNSTDIGADKNLIHIYTLSPSLGGKGRTYTLGSSMCVFEIQK